jgi:uncharacterized protein (TIGR04255 family)
MSDQSPLPRFRNPPVSEVAIGVQFQAPALNPVHLGLYYQRVKARFPSVLVQPPMSPAFETFGSVPTLTFPFFPVVPFPVMGGVGQFQPRMWFSSEDGSSLIQLQNGRLIFNWRGCLQQNAYPHFEAVQAEFAKAYEELEALVTSEGLEGVAINQCELVYVNPLPVSVTGIPLSEPQRIFRIWSDARGDEWKEAMEDVSFKTRYRFNDKDGNPFGRLTVALSPGWAPQDGSPSFQLELTARGQPIGEGRESVTRFNDHAHQAIVRCFAAITTPEMHERWGRYQ